MKLLLDTHFLIWIVLESKRLSSFPWLDRYQPWGISPISLLELRCLAEIGRLEIREPEFSDTLFEDQRFIIDEVPLMRLIQHAVDLNWTRDLFDRLLVAHSAARRTPFCTLDRKIRENYALLAKELT